MGTEFGFCQACGSAVAEAIQKTCLSCGAVLATPHGSRTGRRPIVALVGAVAIVALVGVGGYALGIGTRVSVAVSASPSALIAKMSPEPGPIFPGAVTFEPSTLSCSASRIPTMLTIRLPASVPDSYALYASPGGSKDGGVNGSVIVVGNEFRKLDDGSWISRDEDQSDLVCAMDGLGKHDYRLYDADGDVAVEGSVTYNP